MAHKKSVWTWDEVSVIMGDAFILGKSVARNADYYSLSNPLSDLKDKVQRDKISQLRASNKPTKPKKEKRTFIDATGMIWLIKKESIEKKRGEYRYWMGDSIDGKYGFKGDLKRDVINQIKNKFGEFGK